MSTTNEIIMLTGSSNKFGSEIYALADELRGEGKFVVDDQMFHTLPEHLGRKHFLRWLLDANRLLVYNKNGYIGYHTRLEIAIAEVIGIPVEFIFPVDKCCTDCIEYFHLLLPLSDIDWHICMSKNKNGGVMKDLKVCMEFKEQDTIVGG